MIYRIQCIGNQIWAIRRTLKNDFVSHFLIIISQLAIASWRQADYLWIKDEYTSPWITKLWQDCHNLCGKCRTVCNPGDLFSGESLTPLRWPLTPGLRPRGVLQYDPPVLATTLSHGSFAPSDIMGRLDHQIAIPCHTQQWNPGCDLSRDVRLNQCAIQHGERTTLRTYNETDIWSFPWDDNNIFKFCIWVMVNITKQKCDQG